MDFYRKWNTVMLHKEIKNIWDVESSQMQADICQKLNLSKTTVDTV